MRTSGSNVDGIRSKRISCFSLLQIYTLRILYTKQLLSSSKGLLSFINLRNQLLGFPGNLQMEALWKAGQELPRYILYLQILGQARIARVGQLILQVCVVPAL